MSALLKTKVGRICLVAFLVLMAVVFRHVAGRRAQRVQTATALALPPPLPASGAVPPVPAGALAPRPQPAPVAPPSRPDWNAVAENAAFLDRVGRLAKPDREERDVHGVAMTRRETARPTRSAMHEADDPLSAAAAGAIPVRASLRLQGRPAATTSTTPPLPVSERQPPAADQRVPIGASADPSSTSLADLPWDPSTRSRPRPTRFNPYGGVIKCELVFTIDSANEQTPLVALVMEPVYNNGVLVIPAGAELHGVARADRLRDRICSGQDWILVFPREHDRPNGRQLNVKGVALDRVEPDANGMTWGLSDGSFGLEGQVIRTLNNAEIKRFVATFLAAGAVTLQQRQTTGRGREVVSNTPQNAALQGLAANLEQVAADLSAEIAEHGAFVRVPAGHQFYFYPMQLIDADVADISSDVATVK